MDIQILSIIAGGRECNASCPFCISKMTPSSGVSFEEPEVNWRNFRIAARMAQKNGAHTAMITSKGEPLLFPNQITRYLEELKNFDFPIIELQTNGILHNMEKLKAWYDLGLTTIAVSIVHYKQQKNMEIYGKHFDLSRLAQELHKIGFSVRLTCTLIKGYIDTPLELNNLLLFAKDNNVEQVTVRPVNKTSILEDDKLNKWFRIHSLSPYDLDMMEEFLECHGRKLMTTFYGAKIYDLYGQNVCFTNSLTIEKQSEQIRQLIFFPDGHLRYDWQHKGAILL